jgi:CRP-like cAMP-binding protein
VRAWFVSKGTRLESLRATREMAPYPDRHLERLLPYFDEVTLPAGTLIALEGEQCSEFVVVVRGRLQAGSRLLDAGESVGWEAMWEREANSATVIVEADAQLLVMSHSQFRAVKALAKPTLPATFRGEGLKANQPIVRA